MSNLSMRIGSVDLSLKSEPDTFVRLNLQVLNPCQDLELVL